jgi:RNA polymerase sigma-70 factor (ECF subfamily)
VDPVVSHGESERLLVRLALAGDGPAFQRLVERHNERVYRAALAVVTDHADALDVTQETWIKAWRGLGAFRGEASLGTWLLRLAHNAAADHLRRRRVRRAAAERLVSATTFVASLDAVEDREEWHRALGGLSDAQRRLVRLRHEHDLRVDEIAALLGVPEGTVKSRLHAAVSALRAWLGDGRGDGSGSPDPGAAPGAPGARPPRSWPGGAVGPTLRPPDEADPTRAAAAADVGRDGVAPPRARRCDGRPARPDRARALRAGRRCRPPGRSTLPARSGPATPSAAGRSRPIAGRARSGDRLAVKAEYGPTRGGAKS